MNKVKQPNMDVGDWVYEVQKDILGLTLEPMVPKRAKMKAGRPQEANTTAAGSRIDEEITFARQEKVLDKKRKIAEKLAVKAALAEIHKDNPLLLANGRLVKCKSCRGRHETCDHKWPGPCGPCARRKRTCVYVLSNGEIVVNTIDHAATVETAMPAGSSSTSPILPAMSVEPPLSGVTAVVVEVPARVNALFLTPPPDSPLSYPAIASNVVVIDDESSTDVRAQITKGSNATEVAGSTSAANVLGRRNYAQVTTTRAATSKADQSNADETEYDLSARERAVKLAKLGVEKAASSCNLLSILRARDTYLAAVHYQKQANQFASAGKGRADLTNKKSLVTFNTQRAQGKPDKVSRSDEKNKERSGISDQTRLALSKASTARNEAFRVVKARREKKRQPGFETDDENDKKSRVTLKDSKASRSDKKRKFKIDTDDEDDSKELPDVLYVKKQRVTDDLTLDHPGADLVIMGERSRKQGGGRTPGVRRCGICGKIGHTRVKCPWRDD